MEKQTAWKTTINDLKKMGVMVGEEIQTESDRLRAITGILELIPIYNMGNSTTPKSVFNSRRIRYFNQFSEIIMARRVRLHGVCGDKDRFQDWCEKAVNFLRFKDHLVNMFPDMCEKYTSLQEDLARIETRKSKLLEDNAVFLKNENLLSQQAEALGQKLESLTSNEFELREELDKKTVMLEREKQEIRNYGEEFEVLKEQLLDAEISLRQLESQVVENPKLVKEKFEDTKRSLKEINDNLHSTQMNAKKIQSQSLEAQELIAKFCKFSEILDSIKKSEEKLINLLKNEKEISSKVKIAEDRDKNYTQRLAQIKEEIEREEFKLAEMNEKNSEVEAKKNQSLENLKNEVEKEKHKFEEKEKRDRDRLEHEKKIAELTAQMRSKTKNKIDSTKNYLQRIEDDLDGRGLKFSTLQKKYDFFQACNGNRGSLSARERRVQPLVEIDRPLTGNGKK
eukprot:GHVP01028918.1.p1 GENE.GHVP01028918.1~~GHVP01028918.1.p1  ORF type:complete len:452 (+),score=124.04 GHVP01028918.1:574-1929(+)